VEAQVAVELVEEAQVAEVLQEVPAVVHPQEEAEVDAN